MTGKRPKTNEQKVTKRVAKRKAQRAKSNEQQAGSSEQQIESREQRAKCY